MAVREVVRHHVHTNLLNSKYSLLCITTNEKEQVAQLWQTARMTLTLFSINVQLCLQNQPPYGGIRGNIKALSESFNAKQLCSLSNVSFIRK